MTGGRRDREDPVRFDQGVGPRLACPSIGGGAAACTPDLSAGPHLRAVSDPAKGAPPAEVRPVVPWEELHPGARGAYYTRRAFGPR